MGGLDLKSLDEQQRSLEAELCQLENHQKILLNKKSDAERKARTRRLIQRGAILENRFPSFIPLSNDEVMALLSAISRLPEVREMLPKPPETRDAG